MTKFVVLSSGSSGNSVFVEHGGSKILVDAGFSGRQIERLLESVGEKPTDLDGIFLTHEHADHSKGAAILAKRFNIPLYANRGTWKAYLPKTKNLKEDLIKEFKSDKFLNFKSMDIYPISTYHDACEPVGFILYLGNKKISLVTDTGVIDDRIAYHIKGSDIYYLEANHDLEALKIGPYPYKLKLRVMGKMGHLSNDQAAEVLGDALEGRRENVFLSHLSTTNNTEELSKIAVETYLKDLGLDTDKDINLDVSKRYEPSREVIL
ncbi:MBL fold metallo-hydrolase [uncultured Anaerococcus sp.]|uniref:MBL fold metallo-hydrolase n=1 Tax=uncultured Anaerococcus sp. TaxID=293428 RepID=UPI0025E8D547|nr:MBL fold metallo-hydrolase [uncultured Anaerococcus sp.]